MISQNRQGMRHDVSVERFQWELGNKRDRASLALAKVVARRMVKVVREAYGANTVDDLLLAGLAKQYGVRGFLVPFTVARCKIGLACK